MKWSGLASSNKVAAADRHDNRVEVIRVQNLFTFRGTNNREYVLTSDFSQKGNYVPGIGEIPQDRGTNPNYMSFVTIPLQTTRQKGATADDRDLLKTSKGTDHSQKMATEATEAENKGTGVQTNEYIDGKPETGIEAKIEYIYYNYGLDEVCSSIDELKEKYLTGKEENVEKLQKLDLKDSQKVKEFVREVKEFFGRARGPIG